MAHYAWQEGTALGTKLRRGLDNLRSARHDLEDVNAALTKMSNAQITALLLFSDGVAAPSDTVAGNAKAELAADVARLLAPDAGGAAIQQMLNQFA